MNKASYLNVASTDEDADRADKNVLSRSIIAKNEL